MSVMHTSAASEDTRVANPAGCRICFVISDTPVMREFGEAMVSVAQTQGHHASLHVESDEDLIDADLVVITGSCLKKTGFIDQLRARHGRQREIVIWQTESLPPPAMSPLGEVIGRRVLRWSWSNLPRWARRGLEPIIPFRTRLIAGIWWWIARPYRRELAGDPTGQGWGGFDVQRFRESMAEYFALREALDAGVVDRIVASTASRVALLKRQGISATLCPVGYHEGCGRDLKGERDIDVLFFGVTKRNRRRRLLHELGKGLRARGRTLKIVRGACFGKERERLLNRSRIVLNLQRMPWDFPAMRLYMAMGCGALVVSESGGNPEPFQPDEHLVVASPDQLLERIMFFLEHEEQRLHIAGQGHRFVREELNMNRQFSLLLEGSRLRANGGTS